MVLLISLFCIQTKAQTFILKAGLNLSNMFEKDEYDIYSNDYRMNPGFHIGGTVDIPISDILSFESGLLLTTKGYKYEKEEMGFSTKAKMNLYYLDIPLNFKASYKISEGLKLFGAVGPYVGIGLSGKMKATNVYQGGEETEEEDVKWGSDEENDDLKRLDMGLTFGGGVEFNAIMLGISYDRSLVNISAFHEDGATLENKVLKFSVGYRF